jgi:hypothetical protein
MNDLKGIPQEVEGPRTRVDMGPSEPEGGVELDSELASTTASVEQAIAAAESAANPGKSSPGGSESIPDDPATDPGPPPAT